MIRVISILVLCLCCHSVAAQVNYVLNPSLEEHDSCPTAGDQIKFAHSWSSIDSNGTYRTTSDGEPEYCNTCDTFIWSYVKVPINVDFNHFPRTGNGMAAMGMFTDSSFLSQPYQRDYLQGRFYKPLIAGKSYCVSFYVTLAYGYQTWYAINHIGAFIDNGAIDNTTAPGSPQTQYTPQIVETSVINDSINWTKIEGSFTANGNERFITIGNFYNIPNTAHVVINTNALGGSAYYLVDDVSVIESNHVAFAGNDTTVAVGDSMFLGEIAVPYVWYERGSAGLTMIDSVSGGIWVHPALGSNKYVVKQTLCGVVTWDSVVVNAWPLNVENMGNVENVKVFPNPFNDELEIENLGSGVVRIYDVVGRTIYSGVMNGSKETINTSSFNKGIYFLELINPDGYKEIRKIIK